MRRILFLDIDGVLNNRASMMRKCGGFGGGFGGVDGVWSKAVVIREVFTPGEHGVEETEKP